MVYINECTCTSMSELENSISPRYETAPAPPPQTCSLRISKQLVEKVLLMRIFHLCSGPCVPCWDLRWDTKHEKWETFHQTFQTVHILAQHNNNITDSWSENKSNLHYYYCVFSRHASVTKICLCEPSCQQNHTRGDGICCSITPAAAQSPARAVTLACGETRDGSKNYEEWERKGII